MKWNDKVAIVTGASSGIGRAVAREFAARDVKVALVARSVDKLDVLSGELGRQRTAVFGVDVKDKQALAKLPELVKQRWGRLDFVVNNAGVNHRGPVAERTDAELVDILETNLVAPIVLTRAALQSIEADGIIVNVASLAGKVPLPHEATYSASKSGLRAFSAAVNTELGLHGSRVKVAAVCPGPVDTGFFGSDISNVPDIVFSQPMSTAEDVARAVITAVEHGLAEIDVPMLSGKLATAGYLSPRLLTLVRPLLEKMGAKKKARFIAAKA
jgi:short-subunit dehydrogenase